MGVGRDVRALGGGCENVVSTDGLSAAEVDGTVGIGMCFSIYKAYDKKHFNPQ
jgi:hypothetical protein